MPWIYEAPRPHECSLPEGDSTRDGGSIRNRGSVFECDECSEEWKVSDVRVRDDADGDLTYQVCTYAWERYYGSGS